MTIQDILTVLVFSFVVFLAWQKRDIIISKIKEKLNDEKELSNIRNAAYKEEMKKIQADVGREKARQDIQRRW